ncbi:MAG: protein kinase domain-containing protein, partial [Polyangiaceae bacterium]
YLVMEYLEGHDLDAELNAKGPLPIDEAVGYLLQVCAAMTEAHKLGVVHRDLKPSNLFLCPDPGGLLVKVLDFGISKMASDDDSRLTGTMASVGTPVYMSPEQVRSARDVDARADIWALGIILYELLAGRTPFEGSMTAAAAAIVADPTPPLENFRVGVPPALAAAIYRALSKDREARQATAVEFAQSIAPFAGSVRPSVAPPAASPSTDTAIPAPSQWAVTPTPSHVRAVDGVATLARSDAPHADSSSPSIIAPHTDSSSPSIVSASEPPRPSRRWLLPAGGAGALLALALALHSGAPHPSARTVALAPPAPGNAPDPTASGAPHLLGDPPLLPSSHSSLQATGDPAGDASAANSAQGASVARSGPSKAGAAYSPAASRAVRPRSKPSEATMHTNPGSSVVQPAHGSGNPLFL